MGPLATWHLPGVPVGPPARWVCMSNVEGGSRKEEDAQMLSAMEGGLYSDKLFVQ